MNSHLLSVLVTVLPIAALLGFVCGKVHSAINAPTRTGGEPYLIHRSCALVDLQSGSVRVIEPGFFEFALEGLYNQITSDGRPSRLHLMPEPV